MIIPTDEQKTSTWFNCVAFLALIALPYHTFCVIWYFLAFLGAWDGDNNYPLYFSLWGIEILILWIWFHYTVKETPEEISKRKKLIDIAIENVEKRIGSNYTIQDVEKELAILERQQQASNDSSNSSSSNN